MMMMMTAIMMTDGNGGKTFTKEFITDENSVDRAVDER
jgi:hypothetical protein